MRKFSQWDGQTPFWPAECSRRCVIIAKSSQAPGRFVAYGVDPSLRHLAFAVEGETASELQPFTAAMQREGATVRTFPPPPPQGWATVPQTGLRTGAGGDPPPTDPPGMVVLHLAQQLAAETQRAMA